MVNCDVKFDNNPQGVYYSGQSLSGIIELNNEKARKIRGVTLRIEGFAKVKIKISVT
jgi:Arrestin (or S-antigen), N-terminal domain